MFIIYKSNNLNILLTKAYEIIQEKPLSNIFEKEIFVHDNTVLFQHLNIFLANKIGIAANFKLFHPNFFIWKIFQKILSPKELKNMFTDSIIMWKIMKILDEKKFEYFNKKENKITKLKFSFLMSKIFEQYLFYRPDWINSWENKKKTSITDKNYNWQVKLWIKIIHETKKINQPIDHFSSLFYNFQSLINEKKIKKKNFPNRVFIISSFSLNPFYIKILKKISSYIHIYFLHITPCKKNIFNLIQDKNLFSSKTTETKNILSNSLVTLWGQYEKFYQLYLLQSKKTKIINCFKKNQNNSLLNIIKNDFFEHNRLKNNTKKKDV